MKKWTQPLIELDKSIKQSHRYTIKRRDFITGLPLFLTACATVEKTRYREGDNRGQSAGLTVAQEKQMTAEVLPKMKSDYPKVNHPGLQNYISSLGQKLVMKNGLVSNPYQYTFTVVDVAAVNAFALPAGTVFVTAPLIAMAGSEAELMGVLGHEVGHIVARHAAERMYKAEQSQGKTLAYTLGGGLLGGALGYGIGRLTCPPKDSNCLSKAAQIGAAAGAGGGLLIQKYGFMANSREDEMEADRVGFKTAYKSGYDKNHIGKFYEKLLIMEQQSKTQGSNILGAFADAMSTHPPSRERVAQMKEMANEIPSINKGIISTTSFTQMQSVAKVFAEKAKKRTKG